MLNALKFARNHIRFEPATARETGKYKSTTTKNNHRDGGSMGFWKVNFSASQKETNEKLWTRLCVHRRPETDHRHYRAKRGRDDMWGGRTIPMKTFIWAIYMCVHVSSALNPCTILNVYHHPPRENATRSSQITFSTLRGKFTVKTVLLKYWPKTVICCCTTLLFPFLRAMVALLLMPLLTPLLFRDRKMGAILCGAKRAYFVNFHSF